MSDNIKELVKRLRAEEWATVEREKTRNAAADALEVMAGEVERWEKNHEALQDKIDCMKSCGCAYDAAGDICGHHSPKLLKAEAEVERLRGEVDALNEARKALIAEVRELSLSQITIQGQAWGNHSRAEAAEAERDRLTGEVERLKTEAKTATTLLEAEKWARAHVKSIIVSDLEKECDRLKGDLSVMRLKLEAKLSTEQSEEIVRLKAAMVKIEQGDYERSGRNFYNTITRTPSKHDTCGHGKSYWDDCGNCCSNFARKALGGDAS